MYIYIYIYEYKHWESREWRVTRKSFSFPCPSQFQQICCYTLLFSFFIVFVVVERQLQDIHFACEVFRDLTLRVLQLRIIDGLM